MTVIVFAGPTLPPSAVNEVFPEAMCHGPAARGDILRALSINPTAICLIDGYFDTRPAVGHKELLWAVRSGVAVYGAASMGALRAAELHSLGMHGRGAIFAAFARGELERDDEVAVVHGPAASGFRTASDALVNIRATLHRAADEQIGSEAVRADALARATQTFYAERSILALGRSLAHQGGLAGRQLGEWLTDRRNHVDAKRADAMRLLEEVRTALHTGQLALGPAQLSAFPHTLAFQSLRSAVDAEHSRAAPFSEYVAEAGGLGAILTELQLHGPERFASVMLAASLRALGHHGAACDDAEQSRRAYQAAALEIPAVLAARGLIAAVAHRARSKQMLALEGATTHLTDADLVAWYFGEQLGRPVPMDLAAYAASVALTPADLLSAIRSEYAFVMVG